MRHIDNSCDEENVIIQQIYSLETGKEACSIPNKRLLFHGSSNNNILGILKHGLLIAPPEAPRSGLAYGRGVYFADQFKKAMGYTSGLGGGVDEQPRSFVFVAEVSLGHPYIPSGPEYMEKPHDGTNATLALGSEEPDKSRNLVLDTNGAVVSMGELKQSTSLGCSKTRWTLFPSSRWGYSRSKDLSVCANEKIEKHRIDSNTKFPIEIPVIHCDEEYIVTLLSHKSQTANMRKLNAWKAGGNNKKKLEKDSDCCSGDDDENSIRVNIANNNSKLSETTLKLHKKEAKGGRLSGQSEFIVYDTKQIRLKYLIEVTSATWVRKEYKLRYEPPVRDVHKVAQPNSENSFSDGSDNENSFSDGSDY